MIVECVSTDGFEDQLTVGDRYQCMVEGGSVKLVNDSGVMRWYGRCKFRLVAS